jgi:hypothetical protein
VDALADAVPIWPARVTVPRPPFTPADAFRCTGALLQRVAEASEEAAEMRWRGEYAALVRRMRDDITRLCTACLLLRGFTRPRRAGVARQYRALVARDGAGGMDAVESPLLEWVIHSYGPSGRDDERPVPGPPVGLAETACYIDQLRARVARERDRLIRYCSLNGIGNPPGERDRRNRCAPTGGVRWMSGDFEAEMEDHEAVPA